MKYHNIYIIYNPNSTGPSDDMAKELKTQLQTAYPKATIKLLATKYAGHAEKLAYKTALQSNQPLIISVSGDGGYNEVINGAMTAITKGADPICTVLPAGNANDHSRTVHEHPLVELIKQAKITPIDLLKAEVSGSSKNYTRYAHSYIGLGLTPVVAVELNKTSLNTLKELWIVIRTFYKFRPFKLLINNKVSKLDSIIFANIGQMAKILTLTKTAKLNDGRFEVITLYHSRKIKLVKIFSKAVFSGLKPKKYQSFEFTVIKKLPAQFDGEIMYMNAGSKVKVTAEKKVLKSII